MITLPNEINPASGVAATATGGLTTAAADGQGFSALLNSKVNFRQQQQTTAVTAGQPEATPVGSSDSPARDRPAVSTPPAKGTGSARQRDARADDHGGHDSAAATPLPPAVATRQDPATNTAAAGAATQKDADPALDSTAAQNLMALLAQTNPVLLPIAKTLSAGLSPAADAGGIPLLAGAAANATAAAETTATAAAADTATTAPATAAGTAANVFAATDTNADNSAVSKNAAVNRAATQNQTAADSRKTAAQAAAIINQAAADKAGDAARTAIPAVLPAGIKKSVTAMALDQQDQNAPAAVTDSKNQPARTDSDAPLAAVSPASPGDVNPAQNVSGPNDNAITLKKTGDIQIGGGSSPAGTASVATPTLSAAGTDTTTLPAPVSALISAQLGSDEWQQAIGQQVVMYSRNGQQNAELRLHPDNLGTVQISMQVDTNNLLQIHLASGHSQVRAALEDGLPQLRDSLAQSGISLGQSSVGSDATPNWGGHAQNPSTGGRTGETFSLNAVAARADNVKVQTPSAVTGRAVGIDTFV